MESKDPSTCFMKLQTLSLLDDGSATVSSTSTVEDASTTVLVDRLRHWCTSKHPRVDKHSTRYWDTLPRRIASSWSTRPSISFPTKSCSPSCNTKPLSCEEISTLPTIFCQTFLNQNIPRLVAFWNLKDSRKRHLLSLRIPTINSIWLWNWDKSKWRISYCSKHRKKTRTRPRPNPSGSDYPMPPSRKPTWNFARPRPSPVTIIPIC
mmetsp:Transcript_119649/g.335083  ORF Transcript_119649/g.335083 Transcript_119649/m.335083 type:complete len:207 (+) Transcript_119649:1606-2226(+)